MSSRCVPLAALLGLGLLVVDCGGSTSPSSAQVTPTTVFSGVGVTVYTDNKLAWSSDGTKVAFHGAPGGVYEVAASTGATPQAVVFTTAPAYGMYDPAYTGSTLTVMTTWMNGDVDRNIHVVSALGGDPYTHVFRSFNASLLGFVADVGTTPEQWGLSSDGMRAIARFHSVENGSGVSYGTGGVFTLDFSTSPATCVKLGEYSAITDVAISGDGTRLAYIKAGTVYYRDWTNLEHPIAAGSEVSLTSNGRLVGFVSGSNYAVYDVLNGTTTNYALPAGAWAQLAALAPNGTKIAYRIFGSLNGDGLVVGTLTN
jgi:hypothetical protein